MSINLIQLNGRSKFIDYDQFERQLKGSLERTCSDATLAMFNNFPVLTSPEIKTDLIISFCIKKMYKNFYRQVRSGSSIYLQNMLLSVSCLDAYENSQIEITSDDDLVIDGIIYDYVSDMQSLKFGLKDYLVNRCSFEKNDLNVTPVIFIKNSSILYFKDGMLVAPELNWDNLLKCIFQNATQNIIGCKKWNLDYGYNDYTEAIRTINERASEDSKSGFLTKRKIDRIARRVSTVNKQRKKSVVEQNLLFDIETLSDLEENELEEAPMSTLSDYLILLEGKAGTGKTTELISLTIKNLRNRRNARFMTYNHLLVYDISNIIKSFTNSSLVVNGQQTGIASVVTLHAFFFRLSRSLGILLIMTAPRIEGLKKTLNERVQAVLAELRFLTSTNGDKLRYGSMVHVLKELVTNSKKLDQPQKEVGVDFLNFLHYENLSVTNDLDISSIKYTDSKRSFLESTCINNVFINDYYGVLKNIIRAIANPSQFYKDFNIESKFDLLYTTMDYGKKYLGNADLQNGIIPEDIYVSRVKHVINGHRLGNAIVLIDEGQDCHRDEKEILFSIFGSKNMAVSSGGKEQLIRHVELCNWTTSNGKPIPYKKYSTGRKSYRIKKNLLTLCNFVASKFNIAFDLEALDSEDVGELIIDNRSKLSGEHFKKIFEQLLLKGDVNGCMPYESLLILLNPKRNRNNNSSSDDFETIAVINEYDNIEEQRVAVEKEWEFIHDLGTVSEYWDGTNDEIRKHSIPGYNQVRVIYYNSCRGLESWAVTCFDIDDFFNKKKAEKDAEIYLMDTVFTLEERKSMYAATWTLMAMTRAIDTLYLKISNKESEFGRVLMEYLSLHPNDCKIIV